MERKKHLLNLINKFDRKKYNIDLHILNEKGSMFNDLCDYVRVYYPKKQIKNKTLHLLNFLKTLFLIKLSNPKIIHCFLPQSYIFGGFIGLLLNHKNIIMSRRSLNNYQKNINLFQLEELRVFCINLPR